MIDFFSVWTPGALISAVVGGLLLGLIVATLDNPRFTPLESVGLLLLVGTIAGVVFFAGQIVDTLTSQGPVLAWRVASRFGLFEVFILAMSIGMGIGMRHRRGSWR